MTWVKKMSVKKVLLLLSFLLTSCQMWPEGFSCSDSLKVMIEDNRFFQVTKPIVEVKRGEDALFRIEFVQGYTFDSCSYEDYEIHVNQDDSFGLTIQNVYYSVVVSLTAKKEIKVITRSEDDQQDSTNTDELDAGHVYHCGISTFQNRDSDTLNVECSHTHLKDNSLNGYEILNEVEGYQLSGWNTSEDMSGKTILFGSRIPYGIKDLYPIYLKETPLEEFSFVMANDGYHISSYRGAEEWVVVPATYQDLPVTGIEKCAFRNANLKQLYLSKNVLSIADYAFNHASLEEITFFDSLKDVRDRSFHGCEVRKVHIHAIEHPRFSGSFFDTFSDKIDYLDFVKEKKKIVLFSGSSTRYGYDSTLLEEAFPEYEVVNMGVYAYVDIRPQLDIIAQYMKEGDILIDSPEFDSWALDCQFGTDSVFEIELFNLFESNYANIESLDVSHYPFFFNAYNQFQIIRGEMEQKDYTITPKHYDDEMNYYSFDTYNVEGDFILPRANNPTDERIYQPETPYTLETIGEDRISALNQIYSDLEKKGIQSYFTYAPKNIRALTENSTLVKRQEIDDYLKENLSVPVLGNIESSLYPGTCFYLIDNHLSTEYAKSRTNKVIGYLKDELKQ